ncbi:MAG: hypothetical protein FWG31_07050, partial [Oscillospiraceae bacterium]|nr:hypothetical protein [Oscillospiraceae bacterium]
MTAETPGRQRIGGLDKFIRFFYKKVLTWASRFAILIKRLSKRGGAKRQKTAPCQVNNVTEKHLASEGRGDASESERAECMPVRNSGGAAL